jgi:hypothetical protein
MIQEFRDLGIQELSDIIRFLIPKFPNSQFLN